MRKLLFLILILLAGSLTGCVDTGQGVSSRSDYDAGYADGVMTGQLEMAEELSDRMDELEGRIDDLEAMNSDLESWINDLRAGHDYLENETFDLRSILDTHGLY